MGIKRTLFPTHMSFVPLVKKYQDMLITHISQKKMELWRVPMYCQNSLKSNNDLSRIIYISLNGLYGGYLKTKAFILAGNVEYRN